MLVQVRGILAALQFMLDCRAVDDTEFTICDETCWIATRQHDTVRVQASTIDTWQTRYNNAMHTEHSFGRV